jgi:exopolyphosphatase/guanosine-5'-triphosphate,3'-diphosphate pyrophosphatase
MAWENNELQPLGVAGIGSNDIHLLVATSDGATRFDRLLDRSAELELVGAEVEAGGHPILPAAALAGALGTLADLIARARSAGARHILAVGTEALREAANGAAFCSLLAATFGIEATVLSGEEEAGLDYTWATFPAPPEPTRESPLLVVDSGGGSTQVIVGQGPAVSAGSLHLGAESLTRRFLAHDPPKARELAALTAHVSAAMDLLPPLDAGAPPTAVLMGGSADHLAALSVHPKRRRLSLGELDAALAVSQRKPASKWVREYPLSAERGRLLAAGAVILREVLGHYGVDTAQVKADGIRGGLIVRYARLGDAWRADLGLPGAPGSRTSAAGAPRA